MAESSMIGGRRMLKNRFALNFGKGFGLTPSSSKAVVMISPNKMPTRIRTQDSGRSFSRTERWWKRILKTMAKMMRPETRTGLENVLV